MSIHVRPARRLRLALLLLFVPALAAAVEDKALRVYAKEIPEGGYAFYADSNRPCPVQLEYSFDSIENLRADAPVPWRGVLAPGARGQLLFSVRPIAANASYSYRSSYRYMLGDPTATVETNHLYLLPFGHGAKHKLSQGYNGAYSHSGDGAFSVDFDMPVGTPILAARDGVVAETKSDSNLGGGHVSYAKHGNYVLVWHADGSFARYLHLKQNGSLVRVGETVRAGQRIALSGNTGWSSGPHLHFEILRPAAMKLLSMPALLRGKDGKALNPVPGRYVYAWHPGQPAFEEILGENLRHMDLQRHRAVVPVNNTLQVRNERVDDTVLFYARNGYAKPVRMTLTFTVFENVFASVVLPLKAEIPANAEIFLFLVRPKRGEDPWRYAFEYTWLY